MTWVTCTAVHKEAASSSAIQAGVANQAGLMGRAGQGLRRHNHNLAPSHALADIVIGLALQAQVDAIDQEAAE